jgi:uncharacterized iron-regulated membrane protein
MMDVTTANVSAKSQSLHNAIWRWHFYAGLLCIPFVIWLAATGSIYLFKPQIEAFLDRPYDDLPATANRTTTEEQVKAALQAVPNAMLRSYQLPTTPRSAVQIIVGDGADDTRVYVDPFTLKTLKTVPENDRLMNVIFRLHGELLLGDRGSMIVELAASWAIVMIVTGLYLWWPRQARGLAGVVYPRLLQGGRVMWRDLHAVTGLWVSAFALFILLSGLPWASSWGAYFKEIRQLTGTAVAHQDWPTGSPAAADAMAGMADMPGMKMTAAAPASLDYGVIDKMVATVAPLGLAYPVLISPPAQPDGDWTAKSDAQNRPLRTDLVLDRRGGAVLSRIDFDQRHLIDRIVAVGVAAHEGQLFGWANQLLSLATAFGLILMSVSAVVLWWRRRPEGVLGAPVPSRTRPWSIGLIALVIVLGVALPLLGASIIAVALIEQLVLKRRPNVRAWLGLRENSA